MDKIKQLKSRINEIQIEESKLKQELEREEINIIHNKYTGISKRIIYSEIKQFFKRNAVYSKKIIFRAHYITVILTTSESWNIGEFELSAAVFCLRQKYKESKDIQYLLLAYVKGIRVDIRNEDNKVIQYISLDNELNYITEGK